MATSRSALRDLSIALDAPRRTTSQAALGTWRWTVRQRMGSVRDLLVSESTQHQDTWLAARGGLMLRERNALMGRLSDLGPRVLEHPDVEVVRVELKRLLADVAHHVQRLHDLAYDEVEMELGGSE
ncbi:MAG: hypothetical protein ACR2JD_01835 [Nocardioides sp.]